MKIALMSDLHANRQATEAVWAHLQHLGFDRLALLGDYVDYGADPNWVIDFVRQRVSEGALALQGNHDEAAGWARHSEGAERMAEHVQASLIWTRAQLSQADRQWLDALPLTGRIGPCEIAHANTVFCGHMHEQRLYHLTGTGKAGEFAPVDGIGIPLSPARRWLAIPGSVGQPRDGNPAACCAMFDTDTATLTFHRVPYDHEQAAQRILDAGLPASMAERLQHGR